MSARITDGLHTITRFAMTEVFTPPSSCSSSWTFEPPAANEVPNGLLLQNAVSDDNANSACFPSGFGNFGRKIASTIFSPGYCPLGYTSAAVSIFQPVTTAICCSSNYSYFTELRDGRSAVFAGCTSTFPASRSTIVTVRETSARNTQVTGPITMWAQPITVELRDADLSLFITTKSPSTQPTLITSSSSVQTYSSTSSMLHVTPMASTISTGASKSFGISTGGAIGLGVGTGIGGIAIFFAIAIFLWRRSKPNGKSVVSDHQFAKSTTKHRQSSDICLQRQGSNRQVDSVSRMKLQAGPCELSALESTVEGTVYELQSQ